MKADQTRRTALLVKLMAKQRAAEIEVPIDELLAMKAEYNPRRISDDAMERLRASLRTFGAAQPVAVNVQTGTIVGGHMRVEAAKLEGWTTFPVRLLDLSPALEVACNVALNNPRSQGEFVDEDLGAVFAMIAEMGGDASLTGFVEAERRAIADGWHSDHDAIERIAPHTDGLLALIVVEAPTAEKDRVRTAIFDLVSKLGIEGARVR